MLRAFAPTPDHPPFADLPVRMITAGSAQRALAVHVSGSLGRPELPLVCLSGYQRNMLDYADFLPIFRSLAGRDWPVVLIDLAGRGRSLRGLRGEPYSTLSDADDVIAVVDALGISKAVFMGQGHGGHVIMAMALDRSANFDGVILVDSGPVADTRGLVRLRNNLRHVQAIRDRKQASAALRRVLGADYPGESEAVLDGLSARIFRFGKRGQPQGLFDPRLLDQLDAIDHDDVLEPQWKLFDCLAPFEMMIMRTQFSDHLRRDTFEEMGRRRSDAVSITIEGQGFPALFKRADEVGAIADFVMHANRMHHARMG